MKLDVIVPIEVTRGQNDRGHWRTKKARTDAEKAATYKALMQSEVTPYLAGRALQGCLARFENDGARVTLLRPYKPGYPLDDDNLSGAFKCPRDEVARFLGLDDASPRYCWRYVQCKAALPVCDVPECSTGKKPKRAWTCAKCVALDAKKFHVRLRIEILPAADVDPLLTAVRVLREALAGLKDEAEKEPHHNWSLLERRCLDAEDALATADALATFDPKELYNVR